MADRPTFRGTVWRRACTGGECVEVAYEDGWVGVRDGKQGNDGPVLVFTAEEWRGFVEDVKGGRFDLT
ncbi:DUF397 domain-containing protein [Microbispora bryophytorum]|uniref:DUF397 domain-containing protein n=1 Tax=Microbispora bryophytorum TaxID=1460882 RepID=UPI0033EEC8A1